MIRLVISGALALAIATSAEAMSPAQFHEPDSMITESPQRPPTRVLGSQSGTSCNGICYGLCPPCLPSPTRVYFME